MEIKKLLNFTPHVINLVDDKGNIIKTIKSSGVARCNMIRRKKSNITYDNIIINDTIFNTTEGLPDEVEGTYYIVSKPVAEFTLGLREDLLITDEVYRRNYKVIGCKSLAQMIY